MDNLEDWEASLARVATPSEEVDRALSITQKMREAGEQIKALGEQADFVARRLEELDRTASYDPASIRSATLDAAWERLMGAGHYDAATLVLRMKNCG